MEWHYVKRVSEKIFRWGVFEALSFLVGFFSRVHAAATGCARPSTKSGWNWGSCIGRDSGLTSSLRLSFHFGLQMLTRFCRLDLQVLHCRLNV